MIVARFFRAAIGADPSWIRKALRCDGTLEGRLILPRARKELDANCFATRKNVGNRLKCR